MRLYFIPLVQEFYLATEKMVIAENRIIPTRARDTGRIESGYLLEKSHPYYHIKGLYWRTIPLVSRIFILHFHEILLGFVHSQLTPQKSYIILDHQKICGIKLYLDPHRSTRLCIEVLDEEAKNFVLAETLEKVECRIFARLLHHYLNRGEIIEEALNASVECFFSQKSFKLQTPKV